MVTGAETIVYLGLGSNMGDRKAHIDSAVSAIARLPATRLLRRSGLYETKPWGNTDQPDYLNMVVEIGTALSPHTLLRHCADIEKRAGREPGEKWGPRPMDIDILLYGKRRIRTATLQVPHPHMWDRAFVLRPLADLVPDMRGPGGTMITDLLEQQPFSSQGVEPYIEARNEQDEDHEDG